MRKTISVPPPSDFSSFTPSELFRFFFQIGRWTEDSFSDELQAFTRGKLVSTVTINKWKNRDVIPTRYSGPFLKLIESVIEPGLAKDWIIAFETVWGLHSAGRKQDKIRTRDTTPSDAIRHQHQNWIQALYAEKLSAAPFSPSDIYVPLQLIDVSRNDPHPQDVEDIVELLRGPENAKPNMDWMFISGGPGSGKSITALHLANLLCEEQVFPIFIRGKHLSDIDIDIADPDRPIGDSFSTKSFLKNFRSSSCRTACLILDGLDEIHQSSHGSAKSLDRFMSELKTEQMACAAHNKILRIVALGRHTPLQFSRNQLPSGAALHFQLLGLDGSSAGETHGLSFVQGEDLRGVWWFKYLAATNHLLDPSLPDFLSTEYDDFSEFGSDPLLTYLICHTALNAPQNTPDLKQLPHERVNALTYSSNKNEIYRSIIERLAVNVQDTLDLKHFLSVLQHMALSTWQTREGQSVSLESIYTSIQNEDTKAAFRLLDLSKNSALMPTDMLVSRFYPQLPQDGTASEQSAMEFTHKTFAEYLVSTCLFDHFTRLISAFENNEDLEGALKDWAKLSHTGLHSPSLADFCQKEAALRFDQLSSCNWDSALKIIQSHIQTRYLEVMGVSAIFQMQQSCSLLFFLWSCLNLERQKRTGTHFHLTTPGPQINILDLKSFQRPNGLNFQAGSKIEPLLRDMTFLTPSLSALHLTSADMSQMSFSLGHIENLICEDCSFAMTHWSHVKTTEASFIRSVFQQAIFHQCRIMETTISNCLFQGSRFQGGIFSACMLEDTSFSQCHFSDVEFASSDLETVVFDRCVFTQCAFTRPKNMDHLLNAKFRHCTFIDMESGLEAIPTKNIENSMSQKAETARSQTPISQQKAEFDDLL